MPSNNRIIMCAAGGGKTTRIVNDALKDAHSRSLLVTYTRNNQNEIERKFYDREPVIPAQVEVMTWFTFLLRELARPYRGILHTRRIDNLMFVEGKSVALIPATNVAAHYFAEDRYIYSDKISKFICECNRLTNGAVMDRLAMRFDHLIVDEVQDMAGYDLDLLELVLKSGVKLTLVGDHRQATFKTNNNAKNAAYSGPKIIRKFAEWATADLAILCHERHTHRCHQKIADLGDSFFPGEAATTSLNTESTGHDGVFVVAPSKVAEYMKAFSPQVLRLDVKTTCDGLPAMNFGESKGLTFKRVLIFPHGKAKQWLRTGALTHIAKSVSKMYVGVTRARHSLAFVYEGPVALPGAQIYK